MSLLPRTTRQLSERGGLIYSGKAAPIIAFIWFYCYIIQRFSAFVKSFLIILMSICISQCKESDKILEQR